MCHAGNYLVSATLPLYFYTFMVGNYKCRPTITLASGTFQVPSLAHATPSL